MKRQKGEEKWKERIHPEVTQWANFKSPTARVLLSMESLPLCTPWQPRFPVTRGEGGFRRCQCVGLWPDSWERTPRVGAKAKGQPLRWDLLQVTRHSERRARGSAPDLGGAGPAWDRPGGTTTRSHPLPPARKTMGAGGSRRGLPRVG